MRSLVFLSFLSCAIAGRLRKNLASTRLDINQKVYVGGQAVLGDGTGEGALEECRPFADYLVENPDDPEVKVCGTGIKMTVFMLGRCGVGSASHAHLGHKWVVGACDTGAPPTT